MKEREKTCLLVSACLLGTPCRYDGASQENAGVRELLATHPTLCPIPVCPEMAGGLPCPRIPAERQGARVVNRAGVDVTDAYRRGAAHALSLARENGCTLALLKERSPSCGHNRIYDGSFTGKTVIGRGVCCEMLENAGISVFSEEELDALSAALASQE